MKKIAVLILTLCLACSTSSMCEPQESLKTSPSDKNTLKVSPDSLGKIVINRSIELMTRDGTYIRGKIVQASAEEIMVRIKKAWPKGRIIGREATLRPADVSVIKMKKAGNSTLPIVLGVLAGAMGGGAIAAGGDPNAADQGALTALVVTAIALCATGGVLLGRQLSQKTVVIIVERP